MNPAIERLKDMPRELTAEQAAYVMDRSRDFIIRAINAKPSKLEHRADSGRGSGANRRYLITREALLVFIVRSTGGDRMTLMQAVDALLPKSLRDLAHLVAAEKSGRGDLPANVIPMTGCKRSAKTEAARFDHPDLFAQHSA